MDQLTLPPNPVYSSQNDVRVWSDMPYDNGSFKDYLTRLHWDIKDLTDTSRSTKTITQIHGVLQEWCYFGILVEFFGSNAPELFKHSPTTGDRYIVTKALSTLATSWLGKQTSLSAHIRRQTALHLIDCFSIIKALFKDIAFSPPRFERDLDSKLLFSILVLLEFLLQLMLEGLGDAITSAEKDDLVQGFLPVCKNLVRARMADSGWCPFDIRRFVNESNAAEAFYVSNLQRLSPDKDHRAAKCHAQKCRAYNINPTQYRTKHTSASCDCPFVFTDQNKLYKILKDGKHGVPLATPSGPTTRSYLDTSMAPVKNPFIDLQSSEDTIKYVAISHVWSDGLGNQTENGIPQCQFERISNLVSNLYGGERVPFWLDTLSFPLQPLEAYNLALIRMRDAYQHADKVLVLDASYSPHEFSQADSLEVAARIMVSPWSRRLWTLQEAILAKALVFQFGTRQVDCDELLYRWRDEILTKVRDPTTGHIRRADLLFTYNGIWRFIKSLRFVKAPNDDGQFDLGDSRSVVNARIIANKDFDMITAASRLAYRETSVAADEGLCLAVLLNADMSIVSNATSHEDRILQLWSLQASSTSIDASVIFWTSRRLARPGFGWATSTFLRGLMYNRPRRASRKIDATLTDEGLVVRYPGVMLSGLINPVKSFYFVNQHGIAYQVVLVRATKGKIDDDDLLVHARPDLPERFEKLAIICSQDLPNLKTDRNGLSNETILGSVSSDSSGTILFKTLWITSLHLVGTTTELEKQLEEERMQVSAWREHWLNFEPQNHNMGPNLGLTADNKEKWSRERYIPSSTEPSEWVLKGRNTANDQSWCVD